MVTIFGKLELLTMLGICISGSVQDGTDKVRRIKHGRRLFLYYGPGGINLSFPPVRGRHNRTSQDRVSKSHE